MIRRVLTFSASIRLLGTAFLAVAASLQSAHGYSLIGKSWPAGSNVVVQFGMGSAPGTLSDGNTSWDAATIPGLEMWNHVMGSIHCASVINPGVPVGTGDRINSVTFANSVFGQGFGTGVLAVTYYISSGPNLVEADVLFNRAQTFDSYRGPLRFGGPGGYATGDVRRVFLHEFGHALGLNHSSGDNIMAPITSNREMLSNDDMAGIQALYGAPTPPPPPPSNPSHLANISTRLNVGVNESALIGGFIVRGSQSKRIILRASGPSLGGTVAGAMADPTLELHNGAGQLLATNDNWQSSSQTAEIIATGVAPSNPLEPALVATLAPGSYTAIVRGANNTQGVAVVEGYELDANTTRLVNLSTRGRIGLGDQVLIGGFIVQGTAGKRVIVRAIGPSLAGSVSGTLANPSLELYNSSGTQIAANDDWANSAQVGEIIASTVAPTHAKESAIVATLAPGSYTAIVRGVNNATGIGLVEVYDLEP